MANLKSLWWGLAAAVVLLAAGIWWVNRSRVVTNVAYVTEEGGAISVIDLSTFDVVQRISPQDINPRGLAISPDGKFLITSNKNTGDITVFSTPQLGLLKRLHIGTGAEFVKLNPAGDRVFATFEPSSSGAPPKATGSGEEAEDEEHGPPAQVASFHIGDWVQGPSAVAGRETEGVEFSRDGKLMLVTNEAQDDIGLFDAATGAHLRDVNVKEYGVRPRGIKAAPNGSGYAVTLEASGKLLLLDPNLQVIKVAETAAKPYGLAFDRTGKKIFVAAAMARKLQIFSSDTLQLLGEVPVGQRCWHFTFTPDDSKILLACGRSNNVVVVDAVSYKPIRTIEGFKLPWGIVTYPKSYGSLDLP
jgi:YVTN family beta-propeller protein